MSGTASHVRDAAGPRLRASAPRLGRARVAELDWLKAIGAVTVVLGHSIRSYFESDGTAFERWLGPQLLFSVAGFLAVSGFLYATPASRGWDVCARRLRRIAIPYVGASLAAQLWLVWAGRPLELATAARELLLCGSFGPYYYVLHIALLTLVAPGLARLPRRALSALTLGLLAAQGALVLADDALGWFWELRNPLRWWPFFLVGWWLRPHFGGLCAWLAERRWVVGASALVVAGLAALHALAIPTTARHLASWLEIWGILVFLLALTAGRELPGRTLARLGESSYALYLFHLFPVYALRRYWPAAAGLAGLPHIALAFALALAMSFAFTEAARALLGPRARDWLGA